MVVWKTVIEGVVSVVLLLDLLVVLSVVDVAVVFVDEEPGGEAVPIVSPVSVLEPEVSDVDELDEEDWLEVVPGSLEERLVVTDSVVLVDAVDVVESEVVESEVVVSESVEVAVTQV